MPKKHALISKSSTPIPKDFLDMVAPSVIKFNVDHFLCGNTFRCVWALREYPTATNEQAILRHLGEKDGVTLRIYTRQVSAHEERKIIHNATNKNRLGTSGNNMQETITAQSNLEDVATLVSSMHRNREPLLHCAVFIELIADSMDRACDSFCVFGVYADGSALCFGYNWDIMKICEIKGYIVSDTRCSL